MEGLKSLGNAQKKTFFFLGGVGHSSVGEFRHDFVCPSYTSSRICMNTNTNTITSGSRLGIVWMRSVTRTPALWTREASVHLRRKLKVDKKVLITFTLLVEFEFRFSFYRSFRCLIDWLIYWLMIIVLIGNVFVSLWSLWSTKQMSLEMPVIARVGALY